MKLHEILAEEMGLVGIDRIKKNFRRLVKRLSLSTKEYSIESKGGTYYMIFKDGKPFAKVPSLKVMDNSFITSVLKRDM